MVLIEQYEYNRICPCCQKPIVRRAGEHESQYLGRRFCDQECFANYRRNPDGFVDSSGYKVVSIKGKDYLLHRIIFEKEFGPIPEGYVVHHINRNRLDNRIENLMLVTPKEHAQIHSNFVQEGEDVKKKCSRCHQVKPLSEFRFRECEKMYDRYCVECRKEYYTQYNRAYWARIKAMA